MTFEEVNNFMHNNDPPWEYSWYCIKKGEEKCYLFPAYDDDGEETGEYYVTLRNTEAKLQCRAKIGALHELTERILVEMLIRVCIEMKRRSDVQHSDNGGGAVQGVDEGGDEEVQGGS